MQFELVSRVLITTNTTRFYLDMTDYDLQQTIKLFGNPKVDKIFRIKFFRKYYDIGLREAKEFVEEAQDSLPL